MKVAALVALIFIVLMGLQYTVEARPQGSSSVSLTGQVTSDAEGSMEGVLVGARANGSTFTTFAGE